MRTSLGAACALRWMERWNEIVYFSCMEAVRKIIDHATNPLTIELPEEFNNRKVEVIVLPVEEKQTTEKKYDFSDLVGKLEWKGDAVAEQRRLRDEWD